MMWVLIGLETIQFGLILWFIFRKPVATNDYVLKPVSPSMNPFSKAKKIPKVHDDESAYRKELEEQKGR